MERRGADDDLGRSDIFSTAAGLGLSHPMVSEGPGLRESRLVAFSELLVLGAAAHVYGFRHSGSHSVYLENRRMLD